MIDIHCHILPGIDDGPDNMASTIAMLRMASDDGITHVVATPHYRTGESPTIDDISDLCSLARDWTAREDIAISLLQGADIRLTYELLASLGEKSIPTINGSRYFLLELPDLIPPHLNDFLFEAEIQGFLPVITHPERNYTFLASPEKATKLRESGALFQLTAMSITGEFGRQVRKFSHSLLKQGYADVVASDAHGIGRRSPVLSRAYQEISREYGEETSSRLFYDNPKAIIENRAL